jgi:CSLREA domain-containing protein
VLAGGAGGARAVGLIAAVVVALVCALALPAVASAELIEVDSTADEVDAAPLDGVCLTAALKCTLRAAIEDSNNSLGEFDTIEFDETVFDGGAGGTISLASSLPAIVDPVLIEANCSVAEVIRPCVGIDGPGPTKAALIVENADSVELDGLAVTDARTGIEITGGSEGFRVRGCWLGIKLDGSAGGDTTGILLGPGVREGRIGNGGPEATNVFAHNGGDGLDIAGASEVEVLGDLFGVEPDGVTPAGNGKDIEIASAAGSEATGNSIGANVGREAAATPQCDGGCNVISGSGSNGIDLEGGVEGPGSDTTILGNYIGLDESGSKPAPNADAAIRVGEAARTTIGGPRSGEANRINGGAAAVLADLAPDLVVQGNLIGVGAGGSGRLAPPDGGISVAAEGLLSPAAETLIAGNEIEMNGGVAIAQQGFGASIAGNGISGAEIGIETSGSTEEHGNLIEGNLIEDSEVNGILVGNSFNEVFGNEVLASGGSGIRVLGQPPFGTLGNLVGGDVEWDENFIVGSGGAAIEISEFTKAQNEVARNQGFANDGLFIDLTATTPKDPGYKVESPPVFLASTRSGSSGTAEPGARVRVFRKASAATGELESFLGEATVDPDGSWSVVYSVPVPPGTNVAATQTGEVLGTSELAFAATVVNPNEGGGSGAGNGASSAPPGPVSPQTKITKGPKGKSHSATAKFKFTSTVVGSSFQCKLDGKPFKVCKSPKKYKQLRPGKHVFQVRAVDSAGKADPTPAKMKFTVLG